MTSVFASSRCKRQKGPRTPGNDHRLCVAYIVRPSTKRPAHHRRRANRDRDLTPPGWSAGSLSVVGSQRQPAVVGIRSWREHAERYDSREARRASRSRTRKKVQPKSPQSTAEKVSGRGCRRFQREVEASDSAGTHRPWRGLSRKRKRKRSLRQAKSNPPRRQFPLKNATAERPEPKEEGPAKKIAPPSAEEQKRLIAAIDEVYKAGEGQGPSRQGCLGPQVVGAKGGRVRPTGPSSS